MESLCRSYTKSNPDEAAALMPAHKTGGFHESNPCIHNVVS